MAYFDMVASLGTQTSAMFRLRYTKAWQQRLMNYSDFIVFRFRLRRHAFRLHWGFVHVLWRDDESAQCYCTYNVVVVVAATATTLTMEFMCHSARAYIAHWIFSSSQSVTCRLWVNTTHTNFYWIIFFVSHFILRISRNCTQSVLFWQIIVFFFSVIRDTERERERVTKNECQSN